MAAYLRSLACAEHSWEVLKGDYCNDRIEWCSTCGTVRKVDVQMDPHQEWVRVVKTPEILKDFVDCGKGI